MGIREETGHISQDSSVMFVEEKLIMTFVMNSLPGFIQRTSWWWVKGNAMSEFSQ